MPATSRTSSDSAPGPPGASRHRWIAAAAVIAFLLGAIRVFALVLHSPVLGYANNFDMVRAQACLQVWPADPSVAPGRATFAAPLERYRVAEVPEARGLCVPGPDLAFGWAGRLLGALEGRTTLSIRLFGALRASALVLLAGGFLLLALRRASAVEALVHALVFLVVIADPANTLYANTFYRELSVLLFAWASVLFLWSVCRLGPGRFRSTALAASVLLLGLSNRQHLVLPLVVLAALLLAALAGRARLARTAVLVALAAAGAAAGHAALQRFLGGPGSYLETIDLANATDTFLGAVLPAADDPAAATRLLGLPPSCAQQRGKTWYTPGVQERHPCPEVRDVSRVRVLVLAAAQPGLVPRLTREGLARFRPWMLRYVGSVEGESFGRADRYFPTLSDAIDRLGARAAAAVFFLAPAAGFLAAFVAVRRRRDAALSSAAVVAFALAASAWVVFYSALLGDGTFELAKHVHLLPSFLLALLVLLPFLAGGLLAPASAAPSGPASRVDSPPCRTPQTSSPAAANASSTG